MENFKLKNVLKPNFFIVGAPKCGTTAMNDYLGQHYDIFLTEKELHFFGKDLKVRERISQEEYLKKFNNSKTERIRGEASVWYLYSKTAAEEIKKFSPEAKILIMLRNPVEVVYSLHSQHLYDGNEDIIDFEAAFDLDSFRRKGIHLANAVDFFQVPTYLDSVLFHDQVKKYFDVFGRENVHVILYDDFITDINSVLKNAFLFLGVNSFVQIRTPKINENKRIKKLWLHRLLKKPPAGLKRVVRIIMPIRKVRHALMSGIFKRNIEVCKREKMTDVVYSKLKNELTHEIYLLEKLLSKDLSSWL